MNLDCPHWERATQDGRCIPRWWAGPPVTWFAIAASGLIFGIIVSMAKDAGLVETESKK